MTPGQRPEHIRVVADGGHRRLLPGRQVRGAVVMSEDLVDFVVVAGPFHGQPEPLHIRGVFQPPFCPQTGQSHQEDDDESQCEGDRESDDDDKYRIHALEPPRRSAASAMDVSLLTFFEYLSLMPSLYSPPTTFVLRGRMAVGEFPGTVLGISAKPRASPANPAADKRPCLRPSPQPQGMRCEMTFDTPSPCIVTP